MTAANPTLPPTTVSLPPPPPLLSHLYHYPLPHPYTYHGAYPMPPAPMGWFNQPVPINPANPATQSQTQHHTEKPPSIPQTHFPHTQPLQTLQAKQTDPIPNPLNIENKSFQITLVGGRGNPVCITEKKFKKQVGKLWLGNNDLLWLGDIIDQVVKSQTLRDFFKHRREGYKALHVIRRSN